MDSAWGHNVRRGYDRVVGSIGRSYDEIKGVTISVSRDFHMQGKITRSKIGLFEYRRGRRHGC